MDENTNGLSLSDYYSAIKAEHEANNAWSAEQAQKAMEWQAQQSATAHQREVADLKAAGLNPVLSAGGQGATTGSGIAAQRSDSNVEAIYGLVKDVMKTNLEQAQAMQNTAKYISGASGSSSSNSISSKAESTSKKQKRESSTSSSFDTGIQWLDSGVDILADVLKKKYGVNQDTTKKAVKLISDHKEQIYDTVKDAYYYYGNNFYTARQAINKGLKKVLAK